MAIHRCIVGEVTFVSTDESVTDGLVTLQERTVNLINQLTMPVVEVGLVVQKHLNGLMDTLTEHVHLQGGTLPDNVAKPWPLDEDGAESNANFSLDKVMDIVDHQRMDILDTLIRVTLMEININVLEAILALRSWEKLVRTQLAAATGPGQLFSPLAIPDDW